MSIALDALQFIGSGLVRPECVVAHASGLLFAPDWTEPGGVSVIAPSGSVTRILATQPDADLELPVRPNGIALEPGGSVLLAHLGEERGAVLRLWPSGHCTTVVDAVGKDPLPPANFVVRDRRGSLWITVSTRMVPRARDYRPDACTGFIALHADGETRIVADGLGYTNECLLSGDERTLFVNETFARRLTAFDVDDNRLANRRTMATFGPGIFPDGLAPAADGSLMVTSIVSNRVLRVAPDGTAEIILSDCDPDHVAWVEEAFQAGMMGRPHLDGVRSQALHNISNLAFSGADLKTAHLGCLLGDAIATFESPLAGKPLPHWDYDLGPLTELAEAAE